MDSTHTTIFSLPSELLALIFFSLDFPSLAVIQRAHSTFRSVYLQYRNHLYRAMSIRLGIADAKTGGSADALKDGGRWAEVPLHEEIDPKELEEVFKSQGSLEAFNEVKTWEEFARIRYTTDQNWLHGHAHGSLVELEQPGDAAEEEQLLWRFKLDTTSKHIIATGLTGGLLAYTPDGRLAWEARLPPSAYPHVELSEGRISIALGNAFLILRRSDVPSPTASNLPDIITTQLNNIIRTSEGHSFSTVLDEILVPPGVCTATKLRWPFLLAVAPDASTITRWNLLDRTMCSHALPAFAGELNEGPVHYVELDSKNLIIAGTKSITFWRDLSFLGVPLASRAPAPIQATPAYRTWPPLAPPEDALVGLLSDRVDNYRVPSNRLSGFRWEAVHHDNRDKHLVAISSRSDGDERSRLMWTVDYQEAIWGDDQEKLEQKTVVLVTEDADLLQLAVENDRAVFIASQAAGCSLWMLNLRSFENHVDFSQDPPKPICLTPFLPLLQSPSRVEITSTEIVLPALSDLYPPRFTLNDQNHFYTRPDSLPSLFKACFSAVPAIKEEGKLPFAFRWETLDGQTLVDYAPTSVSWAGSQEILEALEEMDLDDGPEDEDTEAEREERLNTRMGAAGLDREGEKEWAGMVKAWRKVKEKARQEEVPNQGGTNAFVIFSFVDEQEGEQV
ncbi:hypothetical protein JCM8547_007804 [Rhodosporidiobolus lusitaniae]